MGVKIPFTPAQVPPLVSSDGRIMFQPVNPDSVDGNNQYVNKDGKLYTEEELEKEVEARVEQELKENYSTFEWKMTERNEITVLRIGAIVLVGILFFVLLTKRRK